MTPNERSTGNWRWCTCWEQVILEECRFCIYIWNPALVITRLAEVILALGQRSAVTMQMTNLGVLVFQSFFIIKVSQYVGADQVSFFRISKKIIPHYWHQSLKEKHPFVFLVAWQHPTPLVCPPDANIKGSTSFWNGKENDTESIDLSNQTDSNSANKQLQECSLINTLRQRQNGRHLQTTFSNAFSWMKIFEFRLRFHWILFPGVQLTIF